MDRQPTATATATATADAAYRRHVAGERAAKDVFFRTSAHSPLDAGARASFVGLTYFPVNSAYRLEGLRLAPYAGDTPASFAMPTSDGGRRDAVRTGVLEFHLGGRLQVLTAYRFRGSSSHALFVPFLDETSGTDTYGAGRYLDLEPDRAGRYVLDFNLAYFPYCAYAPHFSCPLTPEENRLDVRIEAGERS